MAGFILTPVYGPIPYGDQMLVCKKISFDDAYATGGAPLSRADLGLATLRNVRINPKAGYVFEYDYTNEKVLAYEQSDSDNNVPLSEVEDTTDLDAIDDVIVEAIGWL